MAGPASVKDTMKIINDCLQGTEYRCQTVSWDDVARGTVDGGLSCWGANITDTRLWAKSGELLYTVRSENWNEKLGSVSASEIALMAGGVVEGQPPRPVTLADFLASIGRFGMYAGLDPATDLSHAELDAKVSIRFQTTFLPVADERQAALEFAPEMYNYQTRSDLDPKNLLLLCTTQGSALQQDGAGAKKLFHHALERGGGIGRYWFEAERSTHGVGGPQVEEAEEREDALQRGKAVSAVLGTRAMGTRFNVLMTVQVPLEQQLKPEPQFAGMAYCMAAGCGVSAGGNFRCIPSRRGGSEKIAKGKSNAARVSRGSQYDTWDGLSLKAPKRDARQHATVTVVIYNTVAGGVPDAEDVLAAIADMDALYAACGWTGDLASEGADFMKSELTVGELVDIASKTSTQPYVPDSLAPQNFDVFPGA